MSITSLNYFVFLALTTLIYYVCPKKIRWIALLTFSGAFFLLASWQVCYYFLFGTTVAYIGARIMGEKCKTEKQKQLVLTLSICLEMAMLFLLKYINIIPSTLNGIGELFQINLGFAKVNLIAPIGISYFTLSLWGYMVDVYRSTVPAEKNYCKLALFTCYYPCLVSGPFIRYPEMKKEFFEPEKLDWDNIFKGFHRIVYGVLKKVFIADTLAGFVNMIFADTAKYSGQFIVMGVAMYAIQIYCDFSGCMDIVIGSSKLYGVKLPENFESPFFSRNLSEFWRRWHITLGLWGKDYIMYPLLKSEKFQTLGKKAKKRFGKKIGKKIPVILSILILWVFIGIWHGALYKYIFAAGLLPWFYFSCSELFGDFFKTVNEKLHLKTETFLFHLFQSLRTIALMLIVWLFALAPAFMQSGEIFARMISLPSSEAFLANVKELFIVELLPADLNPEIAALLIRRYVIRYTLLVLSLMAITVIDYLKYRGIDVAEKFNHQFVVIRYFLLLLMIATVVCFGVYGPGYDPADFIYGGF